MENEQLIQEVSSRSSQGLRILHGRNTDTEKKKKIFEAEVTDVETITFKELKNNDELAREEGYEDSKEMIKEFKKMYPNRISNDSQGI